MVKKLLSISLLVLVLGGCGGQEEIEPLNVLEVIPDLPGPRLPIEIDVDEVNRTGKLPEGVTVEAANKALKELNE